MVGRGEELNSPCPHFAFDVLKCLIVFEPETKPFK